MTIELIEEVESFDHSSTPFPLGGLVTAEHDDDLVLLDRVNWRCHVLPPTTRAVWETIDGERTITQIIDLLVEETELDPELVDRIVLDEMQRLAEAHIVQFAERLYANPEALVADPSLMIPAAGRWDATVGRLIDTCREVEVVGCYRFGVARVEIGTDVPVIAEFVREVFATLEVDDPHEAAEPHHRLRLVGADRHGEGLASSYFDGRLVERAMPIEIILETAMQELNEFAADLTPDSILLHGGAVERDGRVVVAVGVSGNGKSTLTAALVDAGFAYLTDEVAIIDPTGFAVTPYPKAIDLSLESCELLGIEPPAYRGIQKSMLSPRSLGTISSGGQLALLVLLEGETATGEVEPVSTYEALAGLLPSVFVSTHSDESRFQRLVDLCAAVPIVRMPRQHPMTMAEQVSALLLSIELA